MIILLMVIATVYGMLTTHRKKKLNEDVLNCQMAAKKSSKKRTANTFMGFGIRRSLVSLVRGSFSEVGTECGEELEIRNIDNSPRCLALNEEDIGGSWFLFVLVLVFSNMEEPGEGRVEDKCEQE